MKKSLFALALAVAPFTSFASESNGLGYSNVQLDYIHEDNRDGAGLSGSYALSDHFFVTGSYSRTEGSDSWMGVKSDTTREAWTLGLGFNTAIGQRTDWVSQLAYARHESSGHSASCNTQTQACGTLPWSDHANGYQLSTGVRGRLTNKLTANAYGGYESYDGYSGNGFVDLNAGYNFTPTWSAEAGVRLTEDLTTAKLGIRASF